MKYFIKKIQIILNVSWIIVLTACNSDSGIQTRNTRVLKSAVKENPKPIADAATVSGRTQIPVLCYHQLREFRDSDSRVARDYIVPVATFSEQMKLLADSGYHAILPDQLYDWLAYGTPLPPRPVMVSFDDTNDDHYSIALPELNKYKFKGVFFIMTVSLGRPGYMTSEQVKQLAEEGHAIGLHTWNHKNVKTYTEEDWKIQLEKPAQKLASITGRPINYFAYPFGLWNKEGVEKIKRQGFKAAFQLSTNRDDDEPLFTIRRIIVPGKWSALQMHTAIKNSF